MARFDLVVFGFDAVRSTAAAVVTAAGGAAAVCGGRIVGTHFDALVLPPLSVPWNSYHQVLRPPEPHLEKHSKCHNSLQPSPRCTRTDEGVAPFLTISRLFQSGTEYRAK